MFIHPQQVCMTYFEHFKLSMGFSCKFTEAAIKAFIHGFFPCYYGNSTTNITKEILTTIENSGCNRKKNL